MTRIRRVVVGVDFHDPATDGERSSPSGIRPPRSWPSAPVRTAADLMRRTGEQRVLVMKDRALLGIVTT